jgi:FAD:protein FMN transferase
MAAANAIKVSRVGPLGKAEFRALGTGAAVVTTDRRRIAAATMEVRRELALIDAACSRFRPDSELEVVNRAGGHLVAVGPLLAEAIEVALRTARVTDGDVDPTVGSSMQAVGYDRDFEQMKSAEISSPDGKSPDGKSSNGRSTGRSSIWLAPAGGWRQVSFDRRWGTLRLPADVHLDLGATAKASAADRAARRAQAEVGGGVLVSLGGDISTAGAAPARGWVVRVTDWHGSGPGAPGQTVKLETGGLATSSTTVRRWSQAGRDRHHILDPGTGLPAPVVWRTVSVAAASCVDANTASTAAIIRGERSPEWLSGIGLAARLVRPDGSVKVVGGWPAEQVAA